MQMNCPACRQTHTKSEEAVAHVVRAGLIAYVDALCPWCRFVYDIGQAVNSPLGAILCGVAIGAVAIKVTETLS